MGNQDSGMLKTDLVPIEYNAKYQQADRVCEGLYAVHRAHHLRKSSFSIEESSFSTEESSFSTEEWLKNLHFLLKNG